jgi:hypothetical protein
MINLCLVVVATQFSETKQRETMKIMMERISKQSETSLASGHVTDYDTGAHSCYLDLIDAIERFWRTHWTRLQACSVQIRHRFCYRCRRPRDRSRTGHVGRHHDAATDSLALRRPEFKDIDRTLVGTTVADSAIDPPGDDSSVHMTLVTPLSSPVVDSCLPLIVCQFDGCRQLSRPLSSYGEDSDDVNDEKSGADINDVQTGAEAKTEENEHGEDSRKDDDAPPHQKVGDNDGDAIQAACQSNHSSKLLFFAAASMTVLDQTSVVARQIGDISVNRMRNLLQETDLLMVRLSFVFRKGFVEAENLK